MGRVYADRVMETTTTTGTGDIALSAALTGFRRFSAVCTTGDTVDYSIFAVDSSGAPTGAWETGRGTYSAANTLTRTTVQASSNGGAAVSFAAGTKYVMLSENAESVAVGTRGFKGAQLRRTTSQTGPNRDVEMTVIWDSAVFDEGGFYSSAAQDRLTIPTGVAYVTVTAFVTRDTGEGGYAFVYVHHFDSTGTSKNTYKQSIYTVAVMGWLNCHAGPVKVDAGDYFTVGYQVGGSANAPLNGGADGCAFGIMDVT